MIGVCGALLAFLTLRAPDTFVSGNPFKVHGLYEVVYLRILNNYRNHYPL